MQKPVIDSKFNMTYFVNFNIGTNYKRVPLDEMIGDDVQIQVITSAQGVPHRYAAVSGDTNINGICIWNSTDTHSKEKPVTFTSGTKSLIGEELPMSRMLEEDELKDWLRREIYLEMLVVSTQKLYNPAESMEQYAKLFDVIVPVLQHDFVNGEKYPEFKFEDGIEVKITGFGVTGERYGFIAPECIQEAEEREEASKAE